MESAIKLLREQMILCRRLSEIFEELSEAFKTGRSGADVTSAVQRIEPLMMELSKNDRQSQKFLKSSKAENLKSYIELKSDGAEKEVALKILAQTNSLQEKIRHQITNVARLMINSKSFIDYNLNVMSQTVANDTYGADSKLGQHQRRRVFSAST